LTNPERYPELARELSGPIYLVPQYLQQHYLSQHSVLAKTYWQLSMKGMGFAKRIAQRY
jgi:hypothetical protein